ncbi:MAG: MbtH family NRPS accessory protein [Chlorobium sp.]|nr:MAG: MbtH family NRPS accessory protein [Chlorobium sp.]
MDAQEDSTLYNVLVNDEHYSFWPSDRELPIGWTYFGKSGTKEECIACIHEIWTNTRPLSVQENL